MIPVLVIVGIVLILIIGVFNSLIAKKNQVANVFSTIDVMLKKRYDLIPQIVNTVKGYMTHERSLLEQITNLRSKAASGPVADNSAVMMDNQMTKLLGQLFAVVENYPNLKASDNFMHLQRTMTELEEQISAARRAFNAAVESYNNAVEMFPTSIIASMMSYQRKTFFEIENQHRKNPDININ